MTRKPKWTSESVGEYERSLKPPSVHSNTHQPTRVDRNEVLEEVAKEFDKMPFGDTSASFARFVRDMKK